MLGAIRWRAAPEKVRGGFALRAPDGSATMEIEAARTLSRFVIVIPCCGSGGGALNAVSTK